MVAAALKQALQLDKDLKEDEVWGRSKSVGIEILGWLVSSWSPKSRVGLLERMGFLISVGALLWAEGCSSNLQALTARPLPGGRQQAESRSGAEGNSFPSC